MEYICKIREIYKALYIFEKEFAEKHRITINEAMLLCCMKEGLVKTANEICDYIGLSNSRGSRIIHQMEEKAFIKREIGKKDKRQMIFSLTDEGFDKIRTLEEYDVNYANFIKRISSEMGKNNN